MKFGKLIPREIIKIVATRCHILKLKCTIFHFGLARAVPQNPLRELTALPRSLTGFKRSILLREGRGGKTGGNGKGGEKGGEEGCPLNLKTKLRPCTPSFATPAISVRATVQAAV